MGLIARQLEAQGIPTLSMSSALSITRAVNPPRAAFLDYPLGHTTGKAGEPELQREILLEALAAFAELDEPGAVKELPLRWAADDSWKEGVMRPPSQGGRDNRVERSPIPQYQCEADRVAAGEAGCCPGCVFLEAPAS